MTRKPSRLLTLAAVSLALFALAVPASAQRGARGVQASAKTVQSVAKAREELSRKVDEYKTTLKDLIALLEPEVARKNAELEKRKALLEQGIVSRREVEAVELEIAEKKAKIAETRKQFDEADDVLEELAALDQLAKLPRAAVGTYAATNALIRFQGAGWNSAQVAMIGGFFSQQFGHSLPITAYGQTALHTRLGYDHSNSVDVGGHPDSAEGQALMTYLRNSNIPFLAFRYAIPGKATGPHIHIGFPSHRLH